MIMQNKGFTLVEVLIGLSIATAAAVSVAYTIANTNKVAYAGKQTFIATNLAHEGLELTRALRDDIWFTEGVQEDADWSDEIVVSEDINKTIIFDQDPTEFIRTVMITQDDDHDEYINVTSKVDWTSARGEGKNVEIKEKLYNWYVTPTP